MPAESEPGANQRRAERKPVITLLWYKLIPSTSDGIDASSPEGIARTCDISAEGLGILTSIRLPVGRAVFVEIKSNVGAMSAVGTIVHVATAAPDRFRVGIELQIIPPNDRAVLSRLLS